MASKTAAPARPKLDRDVVVDTALAVADAEGIDAVTIRRLAQELSVTPMAMYWHFKDKDALFAAVGDRMWGETAALLDRSLDDLAPADDPDGWASLRLTLEALVSVMRGHPAVADLAPTRVLVCDPGLAVTDRVLSFLGEKGFDPAQAAVIARFLLCSAVMLVTNEPGAEIPRMADREEQLRLKRLALASLPPDRYPHVAASAAFLTACDDPEYHFGQGIEAIVAGVRSQAPLPSPRRRPRARS